MYKKIISTDVSVHGAFKIRNRLQNIFAAFHNFPRRVCGETKLLIIIRNSQGSTPTIKQVIFEMS